MKKNLILIFFSIIVSISLIEISIRIFLPQDMQRYWVYHEKKYGLPVNKKNYVHKLHIFKSYRAQYTFGEFHNRVTQNNLDISEKPKILVLGESFTFGWLIDDENTFIHKMQIDNPNFNLINVSSGAWGSSHYSLFIDLYCNKIKPEKILIFLNTDDFDRGFKSGFYKNHKNDLIKNKIEFADIQQESKFDRNIPFYKFFKKNSHLFMLTRNIVYNLIYEPKYNEWSSERYWPRPKEEFDQEYSKKVKEFNKKIFLKIQKLSSDCGATLHLLNLMWSNHKNMKDSNPNKLFLKSAKSFFDGNNFSYFEDERGMLELYKNPMKYIIDIDFHPNQKGANLIYINLRDEVNKILSK